MVYSVPIPIVPVDYKLLIFLCKLEGSDPRHGPPRHLEHFIGFNLSQCLSSHLPRFFHTWPFTGQTFYNIAGSKEIVLRISSSGSELDI